MGMGNCREGARETSEIEIASRIVWRESNASADADGAGRACDRVRHHAGYKTPAFIGVTPVLAAPPRDVASPAVRYVNR